MPNVYALVFNGTSITTSGSSSRLPTWTRTCLSTYPFDPGIDNYLRSLPDLASSLHSRKLITANGLVNTATIAWSSFDVYKHDVSYSSASNVVDNASCFDYKYPNAWRLPPWPDDNELGAKAEPLFPPPKAEAWFLPPWPDDDELSAKAEPLDERRPEPRHQLNDGQHHSDRPCNTNYDGYMPPSAKPC
jgi:hypothetical protein